MKSVIVIPARYGSPAFPASRCSISQANRLIQWVYERACESTLKDQVLIATDDERIREGALPSVPLPS